MAQPPTRNLVAIIFKHFINSLRPRQITGDFKGADMFGNKYYEIPADPAIGKRKASRWFEPPIKDDFSNELSSEWESWLRGRRIDPPTEQEVARNLAIMQITKKNAIAVEAKAGKMTPMVRGIETFPKRPDYEAVPGKSFDDK